LTGKIPENYANFYREEVPIKLVDLTIKADPFDDFLSNVIISSKCKDNRWKMAKLSVALLVSSLIYLTFYTFVGYALSDGKPDSISDESPSKLSSAWFKQFNHRFPASRADAGRLLARRNYMVGLGEKSGSRLKRIYLF
jgi:hypothetical protein